jgi:hypothetical protein
MIPRPKFKTTEDEIHRIIISLIRSSEVVKGKSKFTAVKGDPKFYSNLSNFKILFFHLMFDLLRALLTPKLRLPVMH